MGKERTKRLATVLLSGVLLLAVAAPAAAVDEKPLEAVMQEMLESMRDIVTGIMVEDYSLIGVKAEAVVYHDNPSQKERLALSRGLGLEAMTFKMFDDNVRRYAKMLKKAAVMRDREAVIESYSKLVEACTACHSSYRARIRSMERGR